jgi:predicted RNA-binding Zn-ribbon protein involved in translation (DUF1610 family)
MDRNTDNPCPRCGATDLGEVITPETNVDECYGPQGTRWRRHIAIYSSTQDRTVAHKCWDCGNEWPR